MSGLLFIVTTIIEVSQMVVQYYKWSISRLCGKRFDLMVFTHLLPIFLISCNCSMEIESKGIAQKYRVILFTDILNEADDSQTLVRFLMYANKMDVEGIIAVSSCHQYKGKNDPDTLRNTVHPNEIIKFVEAYGLVRSNLMLHETGWPTAESLLHAVGAGPEGFGTRTIGKDKSTTGSRIVANAIVKDDSRPLYIIINGGANCLAQAIIDLQQQVSKEELDTLLGRIRVFDNAGQDNAGAWIAHHFPYIHYRRSSQQVYCFMNGQGPVVWDTTFYAGQGQHEWIKENVQQKHGPLGAFYPTRMKWQDPTTYHTIEGGGSGNFIGFINHGLFNPEALHWGGWGGRFDTIKELNIYGNQLKWAEPDLHGSEYEYRPYYMFPQASDSWTDPETGIHYEGVCVPIFRWRRAYQNDFAARMDWCVHTYDHANHNPAAVIGDDTSDSFINLTAATGENISLDASSSFDPDGDSLFYHWYVYPEAGSYKGDVHIDNNDQSSIKVAIPEDAGGTEIHIILEINDNGLPELYDFRRIIVSIYNK